MLTDDQAQPQFWPTRANMVQGTYFSCQRGTVTSACWGVLRCIACLPCETCACGGGLQLYQMQLLTWNTAPGDSLVFHFSGEGYPCRMCCAGSYLPV
jgi:hypothetical protein